jgi:hypothetical protein
MIVPTLSICPFDVDSFESQAAVEEPKPKLRLFIEQKNLFYKTVYSLGSFGG